MNLWKWMAFLVALGLLAGCNNYDQMQAFCKAGPLGAQADEAQIQCFFQNLSMRPSHSSVVLSIRLPNGQLLVRSEPLDTGVIEPQPLGQVQKSTSYCRERSVGQCGLRPFPKEIQTQVFNYCIDPKTKAFVCSMTLEEYPL